jgi:hypothetical protein
MLEAVQHRLDANPQAMRIRRETAEHPFGTLNANGSNPLSDEATAQGRDRDGLARACLQSHARHEHHRHKASPGDNPSMRPTSPHQNLGTTRSLTAVRP